MIEKWLADTFATSCAGRQGFSPAPGHSFSDMPAKVVHVVNLASVRALEEKLKRPVNPLRFRPNIVIDGLPALQELEWKSKEIKLEGVTFRFEERTGRCAATNVDPKTGSRDMPIPRALEATYGSPDISGFISRQRPADRSPSATKLRWREQRALVILGRAKRDPTTQDLWLGQPLGPRVSLRSPEGDSLWPTKRAGDEAGPSSIENLPAHPTDPEMSRRAPRSVRRSRRRTRRLITPRTSTPAARLRSAPHPEATAGRSNGFDRRLAPAFPAAALRRAENVRAEVHLRHGSRGRSLRSRLPTAVLPADCPPRSCRSPR